MYGTGRSCMRMGEPRCRMPDKSGEGMNRMVETTDNRKEGFSEILEKLVAQCNDVLLKYLPDPQNMPAGEEPASTVAEAMQYSVMAGGKRLRPLLIARISDLYGGRRALAEPFMAALEMIHTYSLVHDDLPAMDDDEYRRGRKTTHVVYGEGMAVLAGDALLNLAYETALKAFEAVKTPGESAAVVHALQILARNAGIFGMVGGQCADLEAENGDIYRRGGDSAVLLEYIHSHKTACMISSGFMIGAVLAGAPPEDIALLEQIAVQIGIAFQIRDDILDVTGDSEVLGKQVGSDEKDGKATYITIHGMDAARKDVLAHTVSALQKWDSLTVKDDFLRNLIEELMTRRS